MFKVGEKAVYPAHGVGVVAGIEKREISGTNQTFYILKILDKDMTVMIPKKNISTVGLRSVISRNEIPQLLRILKKKRPAQESTSWNRRHRDYMEKIKTGSLFQIAEVLRELYDLKLEKELSFGERKVFDIAKSLLTKELSVAQNREEGKIEEELVSILTRKRRL